MNTKAPLQEAFHDRAAGNLDSHGDDLGACSAQLRQPPGHFTKLASSMLESFFSKNRAVPVNDADLVESSSPVNACKK